jgi:hypothetical protein
VSDPFDIFQLGTEGEVLWRGAAASLDEAKARIREMLRSAPASYLVMNQKTGERIVLQEDISAAGSN